MLTFDALRAELYPEPDPYLHDPVGWINRYVDFEEDDGLTPYQDDILNGLVEHGRASARGPHGLGKTAIAALCVLWFSTTRDASAIDWKVPTTAGAWRQLEQYLWPEIHKWARRIRWDELARPAFTRHELLALNLKLTYGAAFAVASDDPALIEGVHADHVLYIFDESKAIVPGTFDAAEGAFSGAGEDNRREAYALACSTPGEPSGRFYEIHRRAPGLEDWWPRHVTLKEAIKAGRVSRDWAAARARQWGATSAIYANRVLGEFHTADTDSVIPLSWVEAANERWLEWQAARFTGRRAPVALGVDVAREGSDRTVLAMRFGPNVEELRYFTHNDTTETTGHATAALRPYPGGRVIVDVVGVGGGVVDQLRQAALTGIKVVAFNAGASPPAGFTDRSGELEFVNCLTGDARVAPIGGLRRIYRSRHDGPLFRVQTASGDEFTATPNHHVLTHRGWVPVHALNVGDQLCDASLGQVAGSHHPEVGEVPPKISEVYRAACVLNPPHRVSGALVNFHGDRPVGEVEVVNVDGELLGIDPAIGQQGPHVPFVGSLLRSGLLELPGLHAHRLDVPVVQSIDDHRHLGPAVHAGPQTVGLRSGTHGDAVLGEHGPHSPFGDAERAGEGVGRLSGQVALAERRGVDGRVGEGERGPLVPWLDAVFAQDSARDVPVAPEVLAERVQRLAGEIPGDQVVSIDILPARHGGSFVYTVETTTGAYRTPSVVHRNCRSAAWWNLREMLDPSFGAELALPPDDLLLGDLCAPTWKMTPGGKISVERKVEIKKRLGRSTDAADAVVQACWPFDPAPETVESEWKSTALRGSR